jgi:hypothetical protein
LIGKSKVFLKVSDGSAMLSAPDPFHPAYPLTSSWIICCSGTTRRRWRWP